MFYAIERIGYGPKTKYCIKMVREGSVFPVNGKAYKTEQAARNAAAELALPIVKTGSFYEILR